MLGLRYLPNGRDRCEGKVRWKEVESEVEKQWRVEYRLESGVKSALQSGMMSDAESEETRVISGVRGVQSKVRVRLDSGVKRGAKTGRMGTLGRRRLERKVECKEKWTLWSWRGSAMSFPSPLTRFVRFAGMYLPPPLLPYSMLHMLHRA